MEYNIERSSSVSMFKKQRKLDNGQLVWDSVVKLRKKNRAECSKFPKTHLGIRNSWIKQFSNMLSEKTSSYVLETMCAERTSRQEEIAETLLTRFNNFLEQEASMKDPKTLTHKAMVMMADKLSLWLDKNVKVSKNVGIRLRQMEQEEKQKRLVEEMERLEQERRDREDEKKRKMAEEVAKQVADPKSARDIMQPPSETEPDTKGPETDPDHSAMETDLDHSAMEPETGEGKPQEKDDEPGEGPQDDGQQAQDQEPQPPPQTDSPDGAKETKGQSEEEKEQGGTQENLGDSPEGEADETGTQEGKAGDAGEQATENAVLSGDTEEGNEGADENDKGTVITSSKEDVTKIKSEESVEPDVPDNSPLRNVLGVGETEATIDASQPAPDVADTPFEMLGKTYTSSEVPESPEGSVLPSSDSEFSGRDEMSVEPSKDSATLVEELLVSAMDEKGTNVVDDQENIIGKSVDDKTNMVLNELAEMIAETREKHSPLQEAIKDIMEKELEERLGDKDVETINEVAGKVGTWVDKMVESAAEEYGERRAPSRVRSVSPRAVSLPKGNLGQPRTPEVVPEASHSPAALPQVPTPSAAPPEGFSESSFVTARSPSPQPPVSQKPKGPIFELRKVDTKNIFNVAGITHTKARRKIREARGQSTSSRRISQESLDLEEWAEWAGLVSDVGQNWAKWIEDVAQGVERPDHNDKRLSYDAKAWKNMSKELQREGDVWMKKVMRKRSKKMGDQPNKPKHVSA